MLLTGSFDVFGFSTFPWTISQAMIVDVEVGLRIVCVCGGWRGGGGLHVQVYCIDVMH